MQVEECIHDADRDNGINYSKTSCTFVLKGHTYDKSLLLYITSKWYIKFQKSPAQKLHQRKYPGLRSLHGL